MKTICKYVFCLTVVLWCVSCAKNYDINNLDKTITIGGKYFMSPLISTTQMSLDALLDSADRKKLSVKDGHYYYEMRDTINVNFSVKGIEEKMKVKKEITIAKGSFTASEEVKSGKTIDVPDAKQLAGYDFTFTEAQGQGLVRLDRAVFKGAKLVINGNWRKDDIVLLEMEVPKGYEIEGVTGGKVNLEMTCASDGSFSESLPIKSFTYGTSESGLIFKDTISITSAKVKLKENLPIGTYTLAVNANIGSGEDGTEKMSPEVVYGLVNVGVEAHEKSLPIEDVPQMMQDAILDLQNPVILIDFESNAGIPFTSPVKVAYHRPKSKFVEERSDTIKTTLNVAATDSKGVVKASKYYLADDRNDEQFKGYDFQEFLLRKSGCFYVIPDEIVLEAEPTMDITASQHVVWFDGYEYSVKGDVMVSLPFLFGESLLMNTVQTFSGVPEIVGSTAQKNDISILGLFENNYPQRFVVCAELRDSLDQAIGDGLFSTVDTARCSMDGEVVKDTIFLDFDHHVDAIKASKIKLNITLLGSDAGRCIDSTDYLQLNLKLSTQNYGKDSSGLVIDLDDFE